MLGLAIAGPNAQASPLDAAFFRRIDLRDLRCFAKQKSSDVVEQKRLRVGVREVQSVVIDDLCLLLQPTTPTRLTNLRGNFLSQLVGERRERECRTLLAAMCAFDSFSHGLLLLVLAESRQL